MLNDSKYNLDIWDLKESLAVDQRTGSADVTGVDDVDDLDDSQLSRG